MSVDKHFTIVASQLLQSVCAYLYVIINNHTIEKL